MDDNNFVNVPSYYEIIQEKTKELGFDMPSDLKVGTLLKTLTLSKSEANILELGTGTGLSLSWLIDGLTSNSKITSIDNDQNLLAIPQELFKDNQQVNIICGDAEKWIQDYEGESFDLIFADTWAGKYHTLEETFDMLKVGGFYVIDDMLEQPNWPEGHSEKAANLIDYLDKKENFTFTKMNWSTGLIFGVKHY